MPDTDDGAVALSILTKLMRQASPRPGWVGYVDILDDSLIIDGGAHDLSAEQINLLRRLDLRTRLVAGGTVDDSIAGIDNA